MTAAGIIIQATAESWMGLVLSQTIQPGIPFFMGGVLSVMDMSDMILSYGAPELSLMMAGSTELAHYAGIPLWQTGGCTDSKVLDEQAALEGSLSCFFSALTGGDLCHDVGYTESGMTGSILQTAMMDEAIGYSRRITRGIPVNDDTMALDVMGAVGPSGHFLEHNHTYNHFKNEIWRPKLIDRQNWEDWTNSGSKRYGERVHDRVINILETETKPLLNEATYKELSRICELADTRHKDEELDVKMFV